MLFSFFGKKGFLGFYVGEVSFGLGFFGGLCACCRALVV